MENHKKNKTDLANVRQKAEKLLKTGQQLSEIEMLKILHELQAQQTVMEMQKEEIMTAKIQAEAAIQKYTEFYNFAPSGYFTLSEEGDVIELNLNGAKMLGIKQLDFKNSPFEHYVSNETKPIFKDFLLKIFKNHIRETCEVILAGKDKTPIYVYLTGNITQNRKQCFVNAFDISESKQAGETLREREGQNRAIILETAMDGFWLVDMQGRLLDVNSTYCQMSGYSMQELLALKLSRLEVVQTDEDTFTRMAKLILKGHERFETRHRRKDGSIFDVEISAQYQHIENGRFVAFLHDITERKQVEEKLRQSEERYKSLFQGNYSTMLLVNPDTGEIKDANPAASQYYGWTHSELCAKNISEINTLSNKEIIAEMQKAKEEKRNQFFFKHRLANGEVRDVELFSGPIKFSESILLYSIVHDISVRKEAERALHESEKSVRLKLQSILSPEGSITDLELNDIIDAPSIQKLMDSFYELAQIPMAIIDINGNVLVCVGWQDICTKFHRVHPESCKNCIQSDTHLTHGISEGEFKLYNCKNNLWDMATPINIGGEHKGNLFMGQFFFESEPIEIELFRKQAIKYGFEEQEYLDALDKVPRISKQKIEHAKLFFLNLSHSISQLSYSNIKLARAITKQKVVEDALKLSEERLNKAQEIAHLGSWSLDLITNRLTWSNEIYRIFGMQPQEFPANYEGFLAAVHPQDRNAVHSAYTTSILENRDNYQIEHRVIRKHSGELRHVFVKCEHIRDTTGKIVLSVGMMHDITERKQSAEAILGNERLLRESQAAAHIGSYSADLINKSWMASPEIYEIFGIDQTYPHTLDGWIWRIHPDFRNELATELSNVKIGNNIFEHEYKIIRFNDGQERWVQGLGEFEYDDQSNPVRLIGTVQEITKRKQAEEALKKLNEELEDRVKERTAEILKSNIAIKRTEEKYRTVADYAYNWEFWTDQNDQMVYCSPSCERITGYKSSEFVQNSKLLLDIIYPDDLNSYKNHKLQEQLVQDANCEFQYRIIRLDGSVRWIGHICQPIFDESGTFIGSRGSNKDVTERIYMEQLLKESNHKYELLSENITDGIFICRDGCFEYVNKSLNFIFGYDDHELEGVKLIELAMPDYPHQLDNFLSLNGLVNQKMNIEIECSKKDHSIISVEILFNYVASERAIYGVVHDITEKKQVQKNIIKAIIHTEEKERTYFSKEMHDGLGPLLSTIKLYLQWSQRPKSNKSRSEIIHKAEDILEEALETVKEISYKLSPHLLTNYGLTSAIQSFVDKLAESSSIIITFESNSSRRLEIEIETAIYRAIIECINNTIRHARAGKIFITLNDTGIHLMLHYKDNGIGFNLSGTLASNRGLGLFNLQNRIQSIGGKIIMFSEPGKGVDYQISLNI